MAEEKRSDQKKTGELTRSLPRNYRQIGEPGAKKIYIEDYVYTYLNKLAQPEKFIVLEILSSLKWKSADGFYQEWGFQSI